MEEHTEDARVDEEQARLPVSIGVHPHINSILTPVSIQIKIAVYASLLSNVVLCILQREFRFKRLKIAAQSKASLRCDHGWFPVSFGYCH
jgi:hypothetical protein